MSVYNEKALLYYKMNQLILLAKTDVSTQEKLKVLSQIRFLRHQINKL